MQCLKILFPDHVLQCRRGPAYSLSPSAPTVPLPYSHWPDFHPSLKPNLWPLAFALPLSKQTTYILFCDCLLFMSNVFIQSQFLRKALDQFWKLLNPLLPSLSALLPYFFCCIPGHLKLSYVSLCLHICILSSSTGLLVSRRQGPLSCHCFIPIHRIVLGLTHVCWLTNCLIKYWAQCLAHTKYSVNCGCRN